jgi:hypothetical protein
MSGRYRLTPKGCFEILGVTRVFEAEPDVADELAIFLGNATMA